MNFGTPYLLDPIRRNMLRRKPIALNGLDYIELEGGEGGNTPASERRQIRLFFVRKMDKELLERLDRFKSRCVRVDQGARENALHVSFLSQIYDGPPDQVLVTLDQTGSAATYTLRLVNPGTDEPLDGIDPLLSVVDFTFQTDCDVGADVLPPPPSASPPAEEPPVNYLARDYETFRQLMYDRLALTLSQWRDRHAPDLMVTLVELLAYVADHLSYYQDAVATEAYLSTALHRISVRRHARLVDYPMHEGCNARAWVCLEVTGDLTLKGRLEFLAGSELPSLVVKPQDADAARARHVVFEPLDRRPLTFFKSRNSMALYSARGTIRELPAGTTAALLLDSESGLALKPGDVLMFEWESSDPANPEAPKRLHAHAVRLVRVAESPANDEVTGDRMLSVEWSPSDALPSAVPLVAAGGLAAARVRGNVVLVDQGRTVSEQKLAPGAGKNPTTTGACRLALQDVLFAAPFPDPAAAARFQARLLSSESVLPRHVPHSDKSRMTAVHSARHERFRRSLFASTRRGIRLSGVALIRLKPRAGENGAHSHASHAALENPLGSAASSMTFDASAAVASIQLAETKTGAAWEVRRDLLNSRPEDRHFVAEVDDDGTVWLRFGDGEMGARPEAGTTFTATYRVGHAGAYVGARRITAIVAESVDDQLAAINGIAAIWNPLPTAGGMRQESIEEVRRRAPTAFRSIRQRAVVGSDYEELAARLSGVAAASARISYTGGFTRVRVAVLPHATLNAGMEQDLVEEVADHLSKYRRIGHAVFVVPARHVAIDVALRIELDRTRHRVAVESDVLDILSNRRLDSGTLGFFHPDNLGLGQTIAASGLLAAAQSVAGVGSVALTRLRRLDAPEDDADPPQVLKFRADEAPRLDNDGRYPNRGRLVIEPDPPTEVAR